MAAEPTCGQGIAHHAALPGLFADVMSAVGDNLTAHLAGLVATDPLTLNEKRIYQSLVDRHREAAGLLRDIESRMADQYDLPMGDHDMEALGAADVTGALERAVRAESELIARLQEHLTEHQAMLDAVS